MATYGLDVLQIPGTNGVGPNYEGIPGFQVAGVANIGNTNTGSPFQFRDNQYTTAFNCHKIKGSHNLRFGFEYDKYALNHFQPQGGTFGTARGTFGFDGTLTALKGGATVNFNGAPVQLLGAVPARLPIAHRQGHPVPESQRAALLQLVAVRARSVAGDPEAHHRLRPALGILPDLLARLLRRGPLRSRHR